MKSIIATLAVLGLSLPSFAVTFVAANNYAIEDHNNFTYADATSSKYFDFGVTGAQVYKTFGVLDFDASTLAVAGGVSAASLILRESDYSGTMPFTAPIKVWAVTNNTINLTKYNATTNPGGNQTVGYDNTVLGGYSGQLGVATLLASFSLTSTSASNDPLDTINLTSGLSSLTSLINSGNHNVRLVITTDETGYGTFFSSNILNQNNATLGDVRPLLSVTTTSAPEPATILAGLLVLPLLAKKRRR